MEHEIHGLHVGVPIREIQRKLRDVRLQESLVKEDGDLVIIRPNEDRHTYRWNRPFKVHMVNFLTLMTLAAAPTMETYQLWIAREGNWESHEIPTLVTDRGCLRLQVWRGSLPNPRLHAAEVLLRLNWMHPHITNEIFTEWFIQRARGSPECDQRLPRHRSRRCLLCGSNVLGYPISNHRHTDCLFIQLPPVLRLRFIAINHRAFCPHCGVWSTTHSGCRRKACDCGSHEHQPCQGQCARLGGPDMDSHEQDRIAFEAIDAHYTRCEELRRDGIISYLCPGDAPSIHTRQLFINRRRRNLNVVLLGFAKFVGMFNHRIHPASAYRSQTEFRGLISPEECSARVNAYPLFPPGEVDMVLTYGMVTDFIRFGTYWIRQRRGNNPILTLEQYLGRRDQMRQELPPEIPPRTPIQVPLPVPPEEHEPLNMQDVLDLAARIARHNQEYLRHGPPAHDHQDPGVGDVMDPPIQNIPIPEIHVHDPEDPGDGEVIEPPQQDFEQPGSPEPRPGQRRERYPDDDGDEPNHEDSDDSHVEPGPEPEVEINVSPAESVRRNPRFPQITVFNRTYNRWFKFVTQDPVMTEEDEFHQESEFNARVNTELKTKGRTLVITTPRDILDELSTRPIPHHRSSLESRIHFLHRSLIGYWPVGSPKGDFTIDTLQSYAAYLQGAHHFLAELRNIGHVLTVKVSDCLRSLESPDITHDLWVADLPTFHGHPKPDYFFILAENNWYGIFDELQHAECSCTRAPAPRR